MLLALGAEMVLTPKETAVSGAIAKAQEILEELGDLKGSEEHGLPPLRPDLWTVAVEPREQMLVAWGPASSPRSWTSTSTRGWEAPGKTGAPRQASARAQGGTLSIPDWGLPGGASDVELVESATNRVDDICKIIMDSEIVSVVGKMKEAL